MNDSNAWIALSAMAIGACCAGAILLLSMRLLQRYALARPNARSSHREPTPQGGGIAVIAAVIVAALAASIVLGLQAPLRNQLAIVLAATALIAILGAVDDLKPLPVLPRLVGQAAAAGLVLLSLPEGFRLIPLVPGWLERIALLIAILWCINLTNFMDGIDWITVVEIAPVTAALGLLGLIGALPGHATLAAFALLGAILGFAPFNKPVARVFLGDVGSLPIGLLLAWLLLLLAGRGQVAAALLLPLYYFADATVTLLRRIGRGERFWDAHRDHFYQQALDGGMPIGAILARIFLANIVLGILALVSVRIGTAGAQGAALGLGIVIVTVLLASLARRRG